VAEKKFTEKVKAVQNSNIIIADVVLEAMVSISRVTTSTLINYM
jgi:hypothetical protein